MKRRSERAIRAMQKERERERERERDCFPILIFLENNLYKISLKVSRKQPMWPKTS